MKIFLVGLFFLLFLATIRVVSLPPFSPFPPLPPFQPAFVRLNRPTNFIDRQTKKLYPEPQASLLSGILIGTKAAIPEDFYSALKKTGTLHIIALSGTNISMLISFFGIVFRFLGKRRAGLISIPAIIIFILFVGPSPSVVRAGIMGSVSQLAVIFGRRYYGVLSLFISGLLMLIIAPVLIFDLGFQLSFSATLGIMLFGQSVLNPCRLPPPTSLTSLTSLIASELRLTLAAQIFTLPIIFFNFHQISLISPLTNILIAWTIPILMSGGFLVVFLSLTSPTVAQLVSWFLLPPLNWFIFIVKTTSSFAFSSISFK